MHRSFRTIAAGVAVVVLGACFDFDATTAGGPLLDAGGDTSVPTMPDGGVKPTPDGSMEEDSAVDTGGGPDAGTDSTTPVGVPEGGMDAAPRDGGSFCDSIKTASGVFFCEDFDEGPFSGNWSSFNEIGGSLDETDAAALSPPYSLDEKTLALSLGEPINVTLRKQPFQIPTFPSTLRFGFSVEPLQIDPSSIGAIVLSAIDFLDGAGNRYSINVDENTQSDAAALVFAEQSGFSDGGTSYGPHPLPPNQPMPLNAWTTFVVEIDWTGITTAQASLTVNGAQEIAPVTLSMTVQATTLQIEIGTTYVNEPSSGWELRYDNVWFTMQ